MMEIPPVAVGAIAAALITGFLSLAGLVIAKEQKTSEFRQQWIDSLRDDVANLLATTDAILSSARIHFDQRRVANVGDKEAHAAEFFDSVREESTKVELVYHRILLRINPDEHQSFLKTLAGMKETINRPGTPKVEDMQRLEDQLVERARQILKAEWVRVKEGEAAFRVAKWAAVVLLAAGILSVAILGLSAWNQGDDVGNGGQQSGEQG